MLISAMEVRLRDKQKLFSLCAFLYCLTLREASFRKARYLLVHTQKFEFPK